MKGVPFLLQSLATTGNGTPAAISPAFGKHTFLIETSDATTSAGKVQCETAPTTDYTGTWAALGSEQTLVRNTQLLVQVVGVLAAVRARISTNITGGATVTVRYIGSI